jgi:S-adenosylmethionine decarboxylase
MAVVGHHILMDMYVKSTSENLHILTDVGTLVSIIDPILREVATVIDHKIHSFGAGMGVTGVWLLGESHFSIHTWPEKGFVSMDLYTCGISKPHGAMMNIAAQLGMSKSNLQYIQRPMEI